MSHSRRQRLVHIPVLTSCVKTKLVLVSFQRTLEPRVSYQTIGSSSTRGATTAEKLRGTKVWIPTPGRLCPAPGQRPGWVLGAGGSRPPPVVRVRGYHPRKIFENSDAKSYILVTVAVKCLAFWKLRPRSWGTNTLLVPNLKVGGPVSPDPYGCCVCLLRQYVDTNVKRHAQYIWPSYSHTY